MAFDGNEGATIPADQAQKWIDNYEKSVDDSVTKSEFFGFRRLAELLGQVTAIGVRVYYAKDDEGANRLVLVAVTPEEKNIAKIDGSTKAGIVLEDGISGTKWKLES